MVGTGNGVTFEDAWQLWLELEDTAGARITCSLWAPRRLKDGGRYPPHLTVSTTRRVKGKEKDIGAIVQIGGARGARTVPAALVRALTELASKLEELEARSAEQAAF